MVELALRIAFSLLVVLLLMWGLARLARRPLGGRGGAALSVLARQQLGRNSAVAVVRVVDRALVVGVTDHQVTLLAETELAAVERQQEDEPVRRRAVRIDSTRSTLNGTEPGAGAGGALAGSVLSPKTWSRTVEFLRDRTARKR